MSAVCVTVCLSSVCRLYDCLSVGCKYAFQSVRAYSENLSVHHFNCFLALSVYKKQTKNQSTNRLFIDAEILFSKNHQNFSENDFCLLQAIKIKSAKVQRVVDPSQDVPPPKAHYQSRALPAKTKREGQGHGSAQATRMTHLLNQ